MIVNHEQDQRLGILNTLLTTPHRELEKVWPVHRELIAADPRFYVRLAAWYREEGDVRDHKEMFIVTLVLSEFPGHRNVGLAMLRQLPPYQLVRVVNFIKGRKRTRAVRKGASTAAASATSKSGRRNLARALFGRKARNGDAPSTDQPRVVTEAHGLFRNLPRTMKTEITRYLREREVNAEWFDGSVLTARKAMKRLYAVCHVRPSDRAQQILFDNNPPEDSRLFALRQLARLEDPVSQAKAIVKHRIPYRVAATVVRQMTPAVLVALIEQMSAQELINNLGALRRRSAFDVPEIKALIDEKLTSAKTAGRVSALKASKAIASADVSGEVRERLEDVADTQVKAKGRISRPTALLVDKSASMDDAIELGKQIGALISTICEDQLYAYAFDNMAYEIDTSGETLADWERAMAGISAGGCTSCGVSLKNMTRNRQFVEQIIIITDEGCNTAPAFVPALREYRAELNADPAVVIVRTPGGCDQLERQCRREGIQLDVFQFNGDYYSLPNLVPMLARPSRLDLLMDIMEYPLPERLAG